LRIKQTKNVQLAQLLATVTPRYFPARLKIGMSLRGRSPGLWETIGAFPDICF